MHTDAVRIFKMQFDCKEYTTNFHSDGNLAHSGTSVTGVLLWLTLFFLPQARNVLKPNSITLAGS